MISNSIQNIITKYLTNQASIVELEMLAQRPDLHVDGVSLVSLLDAKQAEVHEVLYWDYPHYHGSGWTPGEAIRKGAWKLIHFYENDIYELYNIENDISEKNNLINKHPEKLKELKSELEKMKKNLKVKTPELNATMK